MSFQVFNDGLSTVLLQSHIARIAGSNIGCLNAGSSAREEIIGDLVEQWVAASRVSSRLAAANPIECALAGLTCDIQAVFKCESFVFTTRRYGEPRTPKHRSHRCISI